MIRSYGHLFALRLSSKCPNRFLIVFFLLPFLLWCLLTFFLFCAFAFIFFSLVAHLISFSFQRTFYPISTHSSSRDPKTPCDSCLVLAYSFFGKKFNSIGTCSRNTIVSLFLPGHLIPATLFNEFISFPGPYLYNFF